MTGNNSKEEHIDVSIVIPCYLEENHLYKNFHEIYQTMSATSITWEVIFVEDCGPDNTREIILKLAEEFKEVRYVFHEKNKGRGGAVKTGVAAARGQIAGFLDVDLEVHCRYIPSMVQMIRDGADIVCGYRIYKVPFTLSDITRDIMSVGYRMLIRIFLKLKVHDTEAGYKFFNVERIKPLLELTENDGWFWDSEIMTLATYRGFNLSEVPMVYIRNADKQTTVSPLKDSTEMFRMLMKFRRRFHTSLIYRYPRLYHGMMKLIYRGNYSERFKSIAGNIPNGTRVLDVCCGDAMLYDHLKTKEVSYTGLDILPAFVESARSRGIDSRYLDVELMDIPEKADIVVMQSSLYQFIPGHDRIIEKLLEAAGDKLIIVEPVSNWSSSRNPILRTLGKSGTNPGTGPKTERFNAGTLDESLNKYKILEKESLCGGREMMYVLDASTG